MSINILWKLLFVISILAIAVLICGCIRDRKKFRITEYNLIAVCICGMVFWLATAPLPRYGTIYVITLPCIATGMLLGGLQNKYKELSLRLTGYAWMASLAVYLLLFPGYVYVKDTGRIPILIQADYANHETTIEKIGDIEIAVPIKGDQTGYNPFPSAPYTDTGSRIELRGATLKDGFRKKDSN